MEYLETKNKHSKAYKFYCLNLRQSRRFDVLHHLIPGHPLNSFTEDWDGGLNSGYFGSFSHKSMKPKMITQIRNMGVIDPVTEVMAKKIDWNLKWRSYRKLHSMYFFFMPFLIDFLYRLMQLSSLPAYYKVNSPFYLLKFSKVFVVFV